jgi:hypothetical protein
MNVDTKENFDVLSNLVASNSTWHLKFGDFRKKRNIKKLRGQHPMIQVKHQTKTMFLSDQQELYQNKQSRCIFLTRKCRLKTIL